MTTIPAPEWKYLRDKLGSMSYDTVKDLNPQEYGFRNVTDMFVFLFVEEHDSELHRTLYLKAEPRIERTARRHGKWRMMDRVLEGYDKSPEHEQEVNNMIVTEGVHLVEELTDYWRKQDKL